MHHRIGQIIISTALIVTVLFLVAVTESSAVAPPVATKARKPDSKKSKPGARKSPPSSRSSKVEPTMNWPSFRGSGASGLAIGCKPPKTWNIETGENVLWKTPIPGLGHSSPIIWGDRVYITTAVSGQKDADLKVGLYGDIWPVKDDTEHEWRLLCLDKLTGKVLWNQVAYKGVPIIKRHTKATHANSTPATDGKHIVAFFGSEGLYCYDADGKLKWKKDFGVLDSGYFAMPQAQWEFGSSPVIHDGRVIIQCDVQKDSFVAALDVKTGDEIWRTARTDVPTWSTPTVHAIGGKTLVLVNGWHHVGAYDFKTGEEVWKMEGGGDIPVPTPVVWKDLVFIASAHGQWGPLFAVKMNGTGDIGISLANGDTSNDHVAWCDPRSYAYMQTPIVVGQNVYNCRDNGVMRCYAARSGEKRYEKRIGSGSTGFTASAVAALFGPDTNPASKARLYYTSEEGDVFVVKGGDQPGILARNTLDEVCMATPAISGNSLFFRTKGHVVAIGEKKGKK